MKRPPSSLCGTAWAASSLRGPVHRVGVRFEDKGGLAMTKVLLAVLLLVLCPMAFTTSAAAECAWVLWDDSLLLAPRLGSNLAPLSASASKQECDKAAEREVRMRVEAGAIRLPGSEASVLVKGPGGGDITKTYRCLPDTVDPRGPKGGGR